MNDTDASTFDQQAARIRRLVEEEFSGIFVIFDEDARPLIRFRIETATGVQLSNASPHDAIEDIEKLNDDQLREYIRRLCGRS